MANKLTLTEGEKFARKCSVTGEGMNEGWIANDGQFYFKYKKDAIAWCKNNGYKSLNKAFSEDAIYWTAWDTDEDAQYIVKNGEIVDIEQEKHPVDIAKAILKEHGYIMCFWQLDDIIYRAKDRDIELTTEQAKEVACYMENNHDANNGINWDFIDFATDECFPELTNF